MNYYRPGHHFLWGGLGVWFWIVMVVIVVALCGLLVVGIIWLVRSGRPQPARPTWAPAPHLPASPAEAILFERFARGEIDEAEFRSRIAAMRSAAPVQPESPQSPPQPGPEQPPGPGPQG